MGCHDEGEDLTPEDKLLELKQDKLDPAVGTKPNRLNPAENTSFRLLLVLTSHTEGLAEFIPTFHSAERPPLTIDH